MGRPVRLFEEPGEDFGGALGGHGWARFVVGETSGSRSATLGGPGEARCIPEATCAKQRGQNTDLRGAPEHFGYNFKPQTQHRLTYCLIHELFRWDGVRALITPASSYYNPQVINGFLAAEAGIPSI